MINLWIDAINESIPLMEWNWLMDWLINGWLIDQSIDRFIGWLISYSPLQYNLFKNLALILERQIQELADSELRRKMNGLESIGVPYFTAIQEHIEKLRVEINDSLQDDRKCRSKSLQKMRFEYGKVLGMCEGILACVYQQWLSRWRMNSMTLISSEYIKISTFYMKEIVNLFS